MKPYARNERVAALIQQVIAELLRKEISDPRLALVTITGVKLSRDLRHATIYYSFSAPGGEASRQEVDKGFKQARGFLKRELAQRLDLRYMPDLKFFYDESIDYAARIESLLKAVTNQDPQK